MISCKARFIDLHPNFPKYCRLLYIYNNKRGRLYYRTTSFVTDLFKNIIVVASLKHFGG